jgi:signal transduction histidine kinase
MPRKETILIIEDNPYNLDIAAELLEDAGFEVLRAEEAATGLRLAREHHPTAILMDLHLPIMDGYEACEIIKSDPKLKDIIIIAFTALVRKEEQDRALACGCMGIIVKPIEITQFANTVKYFIAQANAISGLPRDYSKLSKNGHFVGKSKQVGRDFEEFMMIASYDFQGPLRKIQQFSEQLRGYVPTPETEMLDGIERCVKKMQSLLNDMLTLSSIALEAQPFKRLDLSEAVTMAVNNQTELYMLPSKPRIELTIDQPIYIEGDERLLKLMLQELLENAMKFRHPDRCLVVSVQLEQYDSTFCRIVIEDNGIGFNEIQLERMFQPLQRLHGHSKYPGNGMGLAIAHRIAELHGGFMQAQGKPGEGAIFAVHLPIHQAQATPDSECMLAH